MISDLPAAAAALREWVLPASIQAAALLLAVLLADALLRGRASPRLRAALWWVLVLRLLLPPTLAAPWSLDLLAPSGGGGRDRRARGRSVDPPPRPLGRRRRGRPGR
ncbi:MAG: hypothetical protein L6R43_01620, partial [Planctomycetes bacterium]|nr:hypothetical protein [Planctomycetota bacterium]